MKTNFYILLILLFSFSFGNAQSTSKVENAEINNVVSVSNDDEKITISEAKEVKENDILLIDASEVKESIARGASDIRIYLTKKRKEGNISLVFPKINKAVKA